LKVKQEVQVAMQFKEEANQAKEEAKEAKQEVVRVRRKSIIEVEAETP